MTGTQESPNVNDAIMNSVTKIIGSHAKPDKIQYTPALPKTRSGKIMRRLSKENS